MAATPVPDGYVEDNLGPAVLAVNWVFFVIASLVVASRYYVRLRIVRRFGIDDALIMVTLVFAACNSIFCTISTHYGLGRHIQFLEPDQIMYSIKYVYLCEFFSIMSPGIGRISYAFLLLELVPPTRKKRVFLWTIIGAQLVVDVGTVIISFSQCQPMKKFWNPMTPGNCWSPKVQTYTGFFQGSFCSAVDMMLALFPISLFWNLNMKLKAKVCLCILMGLGLIAMVASIVKTIELQSITEKGDPTYAMATLAIWWSLEAYLVCIAASIPTLRPILRSSSKRSKSYSGNTPCVESANKPSKPSKAGASPFDTTSSTLYTETTNHDSDNISEIKNANTTVTTSQLGSHSKNESVIWKEVSVDVRETSRGQDSSENTSTERVHGRW